MFSFKGFLSRNTGFAWARRSMARGMYASLGGNKRQSSWPWPGLTKADVNRIAHEVMGLPLTPAKRSARFPAARTQVTARQRVDPDYTPAKTLARKVSSRPVQTTWQASIPSSRPAATRANGGLRGSSATRWVR